MPNYIGNVRKTPKIHINPYISKPVSIQGIRWEYPSHVVPKAFETSIANEIIFLYQKTGGGGQNYLIATGDVWKTTKTHMKPYINWPVSIHGVRWNIYHVLFVKILNSIATKYPFRPKMCVMHNCTGNVREIPITHMKPYISRLVSI